MCDEHMACVWLDGCVTGNSSGLYKILHQHSTEVLLWKVYGGHGLTWSNLWRNIPVEQKLKVVVVIVVEVVTAVGRGMWHGLKEQIIS